MICSSVWRTGRGGVRWGEVREVRTRRTGLLISRTSLLLLLLPPLPRGATSHTPPDLAGPTAWWLQAHLTPSNWVTSFLSSHHSVPARPILCEAKQQFYLKLAKLATKTATDCLTDDFIMPVKLGLHRTSTSAIDMLASIIYLYTCLHLLLQMMHLVKLFWRSINWNLLVANL